MARVSSQQSTRGVAAPGHARKGRGRMNQAKRNTAAQPVPCPSWMTMEEQQTLFEKAVTAHRSHRTREAEDLYRSILDRAPDHAASWSNLGLALLARNAAAEATVACRRAIELQPDNADAHLNLLAALETSEEVEAAVPIYRAAFRLLPDRADLRCYLGIIVERLGRLDEAAALHHEAVSLDPSSAIYRYNHGRTLMTLGRTEDAIETFRAALAIDPDLAEALSSLGSALLSLHRYDEAAAASRRAYELLPTRADVVNNYAVVLHGCSHIADAAELYRLALAIDPGHHGALTNLATAYQELFDFDAAVAVLEQAVALRPDLPASLVELIKIRRHICDWRHYAEDHARLLQLMDDPNDAVFMLLLMAFPSTPQQQLTCARHQMAQINVLTSGFVGTDRRQAGARLRIGYLSADYRDHPVGRLLPEMLAQHDRGNVEVFGYALGADDPGRVRRRIVRACDRFVDLHHLSDQEAAQRIRVDGIDVLVDLTGPMTGSRMGILARRPAPIQVSFLGWPGTTGADCIDYVIGDPILTPGHHQAHYVEKIVQMPLCYQPSDPYRVTFKPELTRADCGLPQDAFVFCSFNNTLKLTPDLFDLWLRLLSRTRNSVLWLYGKTAKTNENLSEWAEARGIAAERIVFAPVASMDVYLGRMSLADLFLDSYPYNAGATCNDALWAGLPVLTCAGETYVSRMAASLLRAAELSELITESLADYEALAVRLATEPGFLASLRQRLARRRDSLPVFDMPKFTMRFEAALHHMRERWTARQSPEGFSVL